MCSIWAYISLFWPFLGQIGLFLAVFVPYLSVFSYFSDRFVPVFILFLNEFEMDSEQSCLFFKCIFEKCIRFAKWILRILLLCSAARCRESYPLLVKVAAQP